MACYSPERHPKRPRQESEDVIVEHRTISVIKRKQDLEGLTEDECNNAYYCQKGPVLTENSINNILKVVSLQSFSNSRQSQSNDGLNNHQTSRDFHCGSRSPPSDVRSNGESSNATMSEDSAVDQANECSRNITRKSASSRSKRGEKAVNSSKDDKYWEKRVRNNASAKRSRDARRVRELECQIRSEFMEEENRKLNEENILLREENAKLLKIIDDLESRA